MECDLNITTEQLSSRKPRDTRKKGRGGEIEESTESMTWRVESSKNPTMSRIFLD